MCFSGTASCTSAPRSSRGACTARSARSIRSPRVARSSSSSEAAGFGSSASDSDWIFDAIASSAACAAWRSGPSAHGATYSDSSRGSSSVTDYLGAAIIATRDAGAQFVRDLSRSPAAYRRLMSHQRERIAGLERLIESGTAQGHFRGVHAKLIAEVMLNAVAQLVDPEVLARVGLTMSQAFAELYDIVEHAIEARSTATITAPRPTGARDRSVDRIRRRGS